MKINDMPKLKSIFVRKMINNEYVVTSEIDEECRWVFEDDDSIATEKLDGTCVSIIIEKGKITRIFNRTEEIPFFNKGKKHITEGVLNSYGRGYCDFTDGQYFGELIGPKVNGNPYKLKEHLWIPFETYCREYLKYKSWGKYPKTYEAISTWFKDDIFSLFIRRREGNVEPPEGIVFYRPSTGEMAKLRRDMFDWYKGRRHGGKPNESKRI